MLAPATVFAAQNAIVIRETTAFEKPSAGSSAQFKIKPGSSVDVLAREGGWKQIRLSNTNQSGWVRSYLLRENNQYRTAETDSKADSRGFLAGLVSLSRQVSGFFTTPSASTSEVVATIGVRGRSASSATGNNPPLFLLNPQQITNSNADEKQLSLLEGYHSSAKTSAQFAVKSGLRARSLPLLGGS